MRQIWKKGTKVLATMLILTAILCPPSLASGGWQKDGDTWFYADKRGDRLKEQWKKAGGEWYYLDGEGNMAQSVWIDDESYVGEDGRRLQSVWISELSTDSPGDDWYYIRGNGKKAVEQDGWQKIDGSYYLFDSDGRMKTGWQQWEDSVYYLGQDGRRVTGWRYLTLNLTDEKQFMHDDTESEEDGWFWFSSRGACLRGINGKTIDGKKYCFDQNGRMMSGWVLDDYWVTRTASGSDAVIYQYTYYGNGADGSLVNGWIREEPPEGVGSDGDFHDYYLKNGKPCSVFKPDGGGDLRTDRLLCIEARTDDQSGEGYAYQATIKNKQYLFNHRGEALFGLYPVFDQEGALIGSCLPDKKSGELKKGRVKETDSAGVKVEYYFDSSRVGVTGIKEGRVYYLGRLQAAEADYRLLSLPDDIRNNGTTGYTACLVDERGLLQDKTGKVYETENAGKVIMFPVPGGTGRSLYRYQDSKKASDYNSEDALILNMSDCPDYMDALTEPEFE